MHWLRYFPYWTVVIWYTHAQCWSWLHTVYQCTLRFVTGCKVLTHHCTLYAKWPSLALQDSLIGTYLLISPSLVCSLLTFVGIPQPKLAIIVCAQITLLLSVPRVHTEFGKQGFMFLAPAAWNLLQTDLQLEDLIQKCLKGSEGKSNWNL